MAWFPDDVNRVLKAVFNMRFSFTSQLRLSIMRGVTCHCNHSVPSAYLGQIGHTLLRRLIIAPGATAVVFEPTIHAAHRNDSSSTHQNGVNHEAAFYQKDAG